MNDDKNVTVKQQTSKNTVDRRITKFAKNSIRGDVMTTTTSKKPLLTTRQGLQTAKARSVSGMVARNRIPAQKTKRNANIARSSSITRFAKPQPTSAPKPVVAKSPAANIQSHVSHPSAQKALAVHAQKAADIKPKVAKSAKAIKNEAIAEAMSKPAIKPEKKNLFQRHPRLFNVFTISLIIIVIAGCIAYVNMPNLSVMVASAQAGIDASYPEYQPDGYSLNGPISYSDGQITINFKSNTNNTSFVIKQSKSSWDSSAVKDKVDKESKGQFVTTEEHGLTIYTYDGNAAWVNGGILYTISGNALLSGDQIRHIATSL